ncbi:hypothetical protein [Lactiplantibacillus pentosus]
MTPDLVTNFQRFDPHRYGQIFARTSKSKLHRSNVADDRLAQPK